MTMTCTTFCRTGFALVALSIACLGRAAPPADDSQLPETLRQGYVGPIIGPADNTAYAHGTLGLIRPSYGRASLFVAWRVMHLPIGALAKESHTRQGSWLYGGPMPTRDEDEIEAWLQARSELVPQAPAVAPDYFRHSKRKVTETLEWDVQTGQCGPDAYTFATRTLRELMADTSLQDNHRRAWIAGQDAVFARCTWTPGKTAAPPLPTLAPAGTPARLKALNAYQRAAALFYGDDHVAARQAFDAIAAVPDHPMRAWATLGALRSLVRSAARDPEWETAVDDAWNKRQLRGAAFSAAVAETAARRNARIEMVLKELAPRVKAALADASLAPAHPAINYTVRRALLQFVPTVPLGQAMTALDRADYNPYAQGALDLFQDLYPLVAPDRPAGAMAANLRQHAWFDFVVTVQGCNEASPAQDATATTIACDTEHTHARARWQETNDNAWLLATLMTARQPAAADVPAAEAALTVPADRPEWASLQFYAARVLRAQGRSAAARAALDALAASPVVHKRDREFVEAARETRPMTPRP